MDEIRKTPDCFVLETVEPNGASTRTVFFFCMLFPFVVVVAVVVVVYNYALDNSSVPLHASPSTPFLHLARASLSLSLPPPLKNVSTISALEQNDV